MAIGAIASKAKASARLFDELCSLPEIESTARTVLVDQSSRFQIWAANIGALQKPHLPSSLDHRLREAPRVVDQIQGLLDDLVETLQEILPIVLGHVTNRIGSVDDLVFGSRTPNDADGDAASISSDQSQPLSELEELLKSCTDTVTSLFRSSVLIRSATTRDRYAKAAAAQGNPFDSRYDMAHVEHKFPRLNQADWLRRRLGIANTQRRQFLRYCREHRQKMGTEKHSAEPDDGTTQYNQLTNKDDHRGSAKQPSGSYVSSRPLNTIALTNASTLYVAALRGLDEVSDEAQSQTSYATSLGADEDSVCLRVPTMPESAKSGLPFECHYCWTIQTVTNSRTWKKHVFKDLRPYVCTFEGCDLKVFADRSSWFNHELQVHRVEWCCPFCPHPPFQSLKPFEGHLASRHTRLFSRDHLEPLTEACRQSVNSISPQACPFCEEWSASLENVNPGLTNLVVTLAQFQHHVGSHMERLALFALPRDLDKEDTSADAVVGHDSHSDPDLGSQASYYDQENPPLHIAAYLGLEEEIQQLLRDGSDIEAPGKTWGNVLTAAIIGGQTSIVRLLLEHGAQVDGRAGPFGLPLRAATQKGDDVSVQLLRDAGAMDFPIATSKNESQSDERVDVEARITSVQHLTATMCSSLNDIWTTQGPEVRERLHSELSDVNRMLLIARDRATEIYQGNPLPIQSRSVDELEQFAVALTRFARRLVSSEDLNSVDTVMTWQIQEEEANKLLVSIERLKRMMKLMQLVDQDEWSTTIKDAAAPTSNDGSESDKHRRTFLNQASARGNVEAVKGQLFVNPKSTDVPDDLGDLPLHHAAINGHTEVARILLEAGCNVNCQNNQGMRPLHDAAAKGYTELVQLLLNVPGCDLDCLNGDKDTPLHQAVKYGREEVVQQLISAGAHVNCQDRKGSTPLHLAAKAGHIGLARLLIEAKADVNLRDNNGNSSLHFAMKVGHVDIARLFIEAKADVDLRDNIGNSSLHLATKADHAGLAKLLIEAEADINLRDKNGDSPIHLAARAGYVDIATLLLEAEKTHVNLRDNNGNSSLHLATKFGYVDIARLLIAAKADFNLQDNNGDSSLHLATKAGHVDIARFLIEATADANLQNKNGDNPLHLAYQRANLELRNLLASATTDPTINDKMLQNAESVRNTPLMFAPAVQRMLESSETLEEARRATLMAISRHANGPYDLSGVFKAIQIVIEESHVAWTEIYDWARSNTFVGEPEDNKNFQCSQRCLESKILTMFALTKLLIILNLQRPSQAGLLHDLGLRTTTRILALDQLIVSVDKSMNDEWLLLTCRNYILLVGTLQHKRTNDSESQSYRLELSPNHRTQFQRDTKASISFWPARFTLEKGSPVIRTLSGPYEITWELEKVLANRQLAYTFKSIKGYIKPTDHQNSDEEASESLSDEDEMVVGQHSESPPIPDVFASRLQKYRERIIYETVTVGWLARAASLEPSQALDEHLMKIESMLQQLEEEAASLNSFVEFHDLLSSFPDERNGPILEEVD